MKHSLYTILSISLILVLIHIATSFKDWSVYREYIVKELEKAYDAKVHVGGKIEASLITPKFTMHNVYVQYNKNKEQKLSDLISVKEIEIRPSLLSLFSFSFQPKLVLFSGMKSNKENLLYIVNIQTNDNIFDILIRDSKISWGSDSINIKKIAIRKNKQFFGEVNIADINYNFFGKINTTKNNLNINFDSNFASFLFSLDKNQQGNLTLTINNSSGSLNNLLKIINIGFLSCVIPKENIEISSNIIFDKNEFTATDLKIQSKSIQGTGIVRNDRKSDHTNVNISLSKIDLKNVLQKTTDMKVLLESLREVVPKNLSLNFYMEASNIQYQNSIFDKFHAKLKFANGEINIDTLLQFAGSDNISRLSGKVSNNGNLSEFNGDISVKGESFISHILSSIRMQEKGKSQFTASSKLYLAPRILSLEDIRLLNNKESWQGSIRVNYTKKNNIIDSKFHVHNINIDKYNYSLFSKVQWMKKLKYDVNIRVNVKDSIFNDAKIENLDFLLKIQKNKIIADKIKLFGEHFDVNGSIKILVDQKYNKPLLEVNLAGNKFNGNILKLPKLLEIKMNSRNEINQIQWSKKRLNFLNGKGDFDANLQIKTTELKIGQNVLKNFNLDTVVRNNIMTTKQISYTVEHGQMFFQGYLKAESIYMKFSIANLDIKKTIGINNINGKMNLSGEIKTQGTSFYDWASKLEGNVNFQAQKIEFTNVDFNSFITKLINSKNKPEISKLSHIDIYNGSTLFEKISGIVNINNGICSTSSQFSIDQASGSISSNLILSDFSLSSIFRLFFVLPNHNDPLYVEGHLDGPIWLPKMGFDVDQIYNTLLIKQKNS